MTTDHSNDTVIDVTGDTSVLPWVVLVVDDEPEVLQVTELLLGDTFFQGRQLEILGASSALEARQLLTHRQDTALVLLDVVMESDHAGLALTQFIRDDLGDEDVQIILRTGQPGSAPEQDVILNYDINGYFLKSEITAQKLRSVVIGALRNYSYIKKLRCTGTDCAEWETSASRVHTPGARPPQHPEFDSDCLILSAEPLVQLHDHAWSALQLSTCMSMQTSPKLTSHSSVTGNEVLKDGPGVDSVECTSIFNAQSTGFQIDTWLLPRACELAAQIRARNQDPVDIVIPIASSGLQLTQIPGVVTACLKRFNLPADRLVLELREAALVLDRRSGGSVVNELVACGVRIALVHSAVSIVSIRRLRDIRPSMLKIPNDLVRDLSSDSVSATMVRAIIALAHTLGMSAVAEGVSSQADLEFLRWEGCTFAQGPLVSSSLPQAESLRLFGMPMGTATTH